MQRGSFTLTNTAPWGPAIVEKAFADWAGTLYVYEEYVPGED